MSIETAVNGFGRIGTLYSRIAIETPSMELLAINVGGDVDVHDTATRLEFDQVHRRFDNHSIIEGDDQILVDDSKIALFSFRDPVNAPWNQLSDNLVVVESTGKFLTTEQIRGHLDAGAKRVVLTAPARDGLIPTIVRGVNDTETAYSEIDSIVSVSSCSTNCIAPIVKVLGDEFTLKWGVAKIPHAATNSQRALDGRGKDTVSRRGLLSMIPAATGSAREVHKLFPNLDFFHAESLRIGIPDGSVAMLTLGCMGRISTENVIEVLEVASSTTHTDIIGVSKSSMFLEKILGEPLSAMIDPKSIVTQYSGGLTLVNVQAWFDNEWGYANRVSEVTEKIGSML